ncbi:AfsR/SARP family transcriptional regulator [Fodinicola acaciae]|uniref:AfsR/SARP family transcriptional regulator n=1 Tax=Fodinicola acaciae TaxID=2681555 RepID=UPI0013D4401F|nr:BTAD domain-containing putative transcriptional regulator [Fodinicola acaciae]
MPADRLDVRLLGPLQLRVDNRPLPVGSGKRRALFACLAVHDGEVLSVPRLAAALWDGEPPAGVRNQIQVYVSALRRVFAAAGLPEATIRTDPAGYQVRLPAGTRDVDRFAESVVRAEGLLGSGQSAAAATELRRALDCWRGPALGGVEAPFVTAAAAQLEERRMAALRLRIGADLALGRHAELVGELTRLTADHPLDEGLAARLIVALHGTGRVADALHGYRTIRAALVAELGIEPGEQLRGLERVVLAGESTDGFVRRWCGARASPPVRPDAGKPDNHPAVRSPRVPRPNQLPADVVPFVGREDELRSAIAAIRTSGAVAGTGHSAPPTVILVGPAGAGKSAFAVHLAHELRGEFPDGVLYADLRGTESAVSASTVLAGFLRALGVPAAAIPDGADCGSERSRLVRSALADRRVLVVLDDASGAAQVRPLLPGTGSCAVVVTARVEIPDLAGRRIKLGVLTESDALAMLSGLVGADRVAAEDDAARTIVGQCGHLPLAVRIAGARLAARPHWALRQLSAALADERSRLDILKAGDLAVRASVELTLRGLTDRVQAGFAALGLLPPGSFPDWVLAPLLDTTAVEAAELIDALTDVHLVEVVPTPGGGNRVDLRYRLHDLIRLLARERAGQLQTAERRAAVGRLLSACLDLGRTADQRMDLGFVEVPADPPSHWRLPPPVRETILSDPAAWFAADLSLLASGVELAVAGNQPELAGALAGVLANYCEVNALYDDWRRTHENALASLAIAGPDGGDGATSLVVEMALLRNLGELHTIQDRYVRAVSYFESSLAIAIRLDNLDYQGAALSGLGFLYRILGRYDAALRSFAAASDICLSTGNRSGFVYAQQGIATIHRERGELDRAERCLRASLVRCRDPEYLHGLAQCQRGLGAIQLARGAVAEALETLESASAVGKRIGPVDEAHSLRWLAEARTSNGEPAAALSILERCRQVYDHTGNAFGRGLTWHSIARARLLAGDAGGAESAARNAVQVWEAIGVPYAHAATLDVLADICRVRGMPAVADKTARQAAAIRSALGLGTSEVDAIASSQP